MMKFVINRIENTTVRLGKLSNFPRIPDIELDTPFPLIYTKGGSVPHLTHEVLQMLTKEVLCVHVSLPSTCHTGEALRLFDKGISEFAGLTEYLGYCSVQDPGVATPQGYNMKNVVSVWANPGRTLIDSHKYMELMEAYKPDLYQALCDGDTNQESSKKRCFKSVDNTLNMFDICLEKHNKSEVLKSSSLLAVVEGGYDLLARTKCASYLALQPVDGFVIDGFHNNGSQVEEIKYKSVEPVLKEVLKLLPEEKLRIIHGCWKPQTVLKMVEIGIDVFDTSLAYLTTERMCAFIFRYQAVPWDMMESADGEMDKEISLEISLADQKYAEDFRPLVEDCSCLSCRKHTRAYIHHLVKSKELLASTLLMMHNIHHYIEFFKSIRRAAANREKLIISH